LNGTIAFILAEERSFLRPVGTAAT
jgi:hypothetical protein